MATDFEIFRRNELKDQTRGGEPMSLRISVDFRMKLEAKAMELGATKSQLVRYLLKKGFEKQLWEVDS